MSGPDRWATERERARGRAPRRGHSAPEDRPIARSRNRCRPPNKLCAAGVPAERRPRL